MISKLSVVQFFVCMALANELTKDFCASKVMDTGAGEECGCSKMTAEFNKVRRSCGGKCAKETIQQTCCMNKCLFETLTVDGKVNKDVVVEYYEPIANVSVFDNCVECEAIVKSVPYNSQRTCEIPSNIFNAVNCVSWANLAKCDSSVTTTNCQKLKKLAQDCLELLAKIEGTEKGRSRSEALEENRGGTDSTTGHAENI